MSDSVRPHRRQPTRLSVPGILQERTMEWVDISFSNAWKWKVKVKSLSHVRLLGTPWTVAYQAPPSMGFSRQEYWSGVPLPSPPKAHGWPNTIFTNWKVNVCRLSSSNTKGSDFNFKICFKMKTWTEELTLTLWYQCIIRILPGSSYWYSVIHNVLSTINLDWSKMFKNDFIVI